MPTSIDLCIRDRAKSCLYNRSIDLTRMLLVYSELDMLLELLLGPWFDPTCLPSASHSCWVALLHNQLLRAMSLASIARTVQKLKHQLHLGVGDCAHDLWSELQHLFALLSLIHLYRQLHGAVSPAR